MLPLGPGVDPEDPLVADFRNFLYVVFRHLRPNTKPTPAQYEIANFIQKGWPLYGHPQPEHGRSDIVAAFRGIGKSEILAAYALWLLYRNPRDEKILIVSATANRAEKFVKQAKEVLMTLPALKHLRPRFGQRNTRIMFDVAGASNTQSPSMQAIGLLGQVTGDRASTVIGDDIELWENTRTEERRKILLDRTFEFKNLVYPRNEAMGYNGGDIILLGTPQTEESVYIKLVKECDYKIWTWPARYPRSDQLKNYLVDNMDGATINMLAPPIIQAMEEDPDLATKPTDTRFDESELLARERKGKLNWELHFMLNIAISDAARYPLKQKDFIVYPTRPDVAPRLLTWGHQANNANIRKDIPNWGFTGDYWLGPLILPNASNEYSKYETKIMFVDTSGRGMDETAWCVLGVLCGTLFILHVDGLSAATAKERMEKTQEHYGFHAVNNVSDTYDYRMWQIAVDAKRFQVDKIIIESNFGDGLWMKTFQPILAQVYKNTKDTLGSNACYCEEVRTTQNKELRILDTLEPVLMNHRLVINETIAKTDGILGYQITHMTREKGALQHDDRVDALAGAVAYVSTNLAVDKYEMAKTYVEEQEMVMYQRFINGILDRRLRVRRNIKTEEDLEDVENTFVYSAIV